MADHDHSYKHLFSHARMVEDLLKGFVREEWIDKLDFSSLERVNGSYVSDDLREREDDVVWRVQWGEDWLYVYILLEFQSTVDQWMAVRIMTYIGLLYQDLIRTGQLNKENRLPPVLPVVLYSGERKWTAATDIVQLVQDVPGGLSRYRPRLQYLLLSERAYKDDEELQNLNNLVAALFRLENSKDPQQLLDVVIHLLQWLAGPEQDSLRRAFTVWFSRVLFPSRITETNKPSIEELDEVKTMLAERVKEWNRESMQRGMQKGMQKGMQRGMQRGMQKGALNLLARQLEIKFGPIAPEVMIRLEQADEQQLLEWSEQILTASNISDILVN